MFRKRFPAFSKSRESGTKQVNTMNTPRNNCQRHLSRRGFLRGAGVALALPWLESLPVRAESGKRVQQSITEPPVRFACIYFSNGVEPEHWWAKGAASKMQVGPGLKPLAPLCEDIVFLRGLFNEQSVKNPSAHLGRMPNLLSGAWVSLDQNDLRVGQTVDQIRTERIGRQTAVPSLVLGIEPTELRLEDGLSMIYGRASLGNPLPSRHERDLSGKSVRSAGG